MRTTLETRSPAVARRTLLKGLSRGGAAAAVPGLASCTSTSASAPASSPSAGSPSARPELIGAITAAAWSARWPRCPTSLPETCGRPACPGWRSPWDTKERSTTSRASGTARVGHPDKVYADTVFQLASVSKPISSAVVAAAFTKKLTNA